VLHDATDLSLAVNDYRADEAAFAYADGDYLYIASEVPFNNLWFETGTVNAIATTVSVEVFFGQTWYDVVDIVDQTLLSGASLGQSGRISWTLNRLYGWDLVQDPNLYVGLGVTLPIYWMYWARLSWSASMTAETALKYIGQKFSGDSELTGAYPDLANANLKTLFQSGKTTWDEQSFMAAETIVRELVGRKIIRSRGQIFDWARLTEPSIHKTAEIIYRGLGSNHETRRQAAASDFSKAMNRDFFRVDADLDGRLDPCDKWRSQTFMTR